LVERAHSQNRPVRPDDLQGRGKQTWRG
jgi:hypothetical protein